VDSALREALARTSLRQAAAEVAAITGLPRRQVYARALQLRGPRDGDN
jgi:16S rRNA (cytidine1402-2'-O)-methyltransferase